MQFESVNIQPRCIVWIIYRWLYVRSWWSGCQIKLTVKGLTFDLHVYRTLTSLVVTPGITGRYMVHIIFRNYNKNSHQRTIARTLSIKPMTW